MVHPRKPLTTYTRRSRARAASKTTAQASSPLEPLPADTEDVTMTEMTHRMQKRSRQAASSNTDDEGLAGEDLQKLKKAKSGGPNVPDSPATVNAPGPLDVDKSSTCLSQGPGKSDMVFCTPRLPACSDYAMMPSSVPRSAYSELSPLPAAHHMLSRTSSRHLKENRQHALGSPFSSQPSSRAASPFMAQGKGKGKGKTQGPSRHVKSRSTLSVPDTRTVNAARALHPVSASDTTTEDVTTHQRPPASGLAAHHRTGSIPNVSSTRADDWLAHSATLHKDITIGASPTHSSFFLNVPNDTSTPPQNRCPTTSAMRLETQDYDLTLSDMSLASVVSSGAYTQSRLSSPESNAAPRPPITRMRRRTITNPSGGGLFSSILDFSGSAADEQRASFALDVHGVDSHNRTSTHKAHLGDHASLATAYSGLDVELASAFAPDPDATQPIHGHALHRSTSLPTLHASPPFANISGNSPGELVSLSSSDGQLRDLFVTLQIYDVEETGGVPPSASRDLSEPLLELQDAHLPFPRPSKRQPTHKRQRADTIRASDFVQPSAAQITSGTRQAFQAPTAQADVAMTDVPSTSTRRTRSGTVTLASIADSTVVAGRTNDSQPQSLISPARGHKRSLAGLPTIPMRTNAEPLKLDPDDNEDDELLLKRGSTIY